MKSFWILLILASTTAIVSASPRVEVYFFYGNGCPHCALMHPFLDKLASEHPSVEIKKFEIYSNQSNREFFERVAKAYNTTVKGVPTVFIDKKVFVGYSKKISEEIKEKIEQCISHECVSPEDVLKNGIKTNTYNDNANYGLIVFLVMILILAGLLIFVAIKTRRRK